MGLVDVDHYDAQVLGALSIDQRTFVPGTGSAQYHRWARVQPKEISHKKSTLQKRLRYEGIKLFFFICSDATQDM
jgi:hypothetical protein